MQRCLGTFVWGRASREESRRVSVAPSAITDDAHLRHDLRERERDDMHGCVRQTSATLTWSAELSSIPRSRTWEV